MSGFSLFQDGDKYMRLEDGRIAFKSYGTTWKDAVLHRMPLDDYYSSVEISPLLFASSVYHLATSQRKTEKVYGVKLSSLRSEDTICECDKCHCTLSDRDTKIIKYGKIVCEDCKSKEECENCGCMCSETLHQVSAYFSKTSFYYYVCNECYQNDVCNNCAQIGDGTLCSLCRYDDYFD